MQKVIRSFVLLGLLFALGVSTTYFFENEEVVEQTSFPQSEVDKATKMKLASDYGKLPLHFEPNIGQGDERVDFVSRGKGYALFLTDGEAVLALSRPTKDAREISQSDVVRIQLQGANTSAAVRGEQPLSGKSNYLLGNDSSKWHTGVSHYGKVKYDDVYPGIDLVYYGTDQRQLEHDFVVSPGADPDVIRFSVKGANSLLLDDDGNLIASTEGGDLLLHAPVTYQEIDGERVSVASHYALLDDVVGFELASYDADHAIVIDPILSYSTYLGGSNQDLGYGVAVDGSGNVYVTGQSLSSNYPLQSALDGTLGGSQDVVVSVLNSDGSALVYSTYLGGSGLDISQSIAVDGSGNAYITGYTQSSNYPVQSAFQGTYGGGNDAFVSVLNSTGSALVYSTYLGGGSSDLGSAIAVDGSGNAYVTGYTGSSNFPTAGTPYQGTKKGGDDVYVTMFNSSGSAVYSTFVGGGSNEQGYGIAVDGSGNAYVTGFTQSINYPAPGTPYQAANAGSDDVFVTVLNSSGSGLVYSTYLGGSGDEGGHGIAVDGSGNVYVTGLTTSTDYPLQSEAQGTSGGGDDAFVSKLNSAGTLLTYSTYLGGNGSDHGRGIAVDASGNAHITGQTASTDFPTAGKPYQGTSGGGIDAFVSLLSSTGSSMTYSTYLGGSGSDYGYGIVVDGIGNTYVAGYTASSNYPSQSAFQSTHGGGGSDIFLSKLAPAFIDVASTAGVDSNTGDLGFAWADYDGDGDQDVYVASRVANKLYRNNNNGTFTDVASGAGVANGVVTNSVAWADYDNDGDLDLYLANSGVANVLYENNGSGVFSPVAGQMADTGNGSGQAWADFDKDGDLDLYFGNFGTQANRLYQNNGNGTFTDIASSTGMNTTISTAGSAWGDYDNDGDSDLYVNHPGAANRLFRNDGSSTFVEVGGSAFVGDTGNGRGVVWGDIDNDGDQDLYAINDGAAKKMYRNNGNGTFTPIGGIVEDANGGTGGSMGDYDNDGDLDLYLVRYGQANTLFDNDGTGSFIDVTEAESVGDANNGFDGQFIDYDNDGDLDIYVANDFQANTLYKNTLSGNNWLHVDLTGTSSPNDAMGARIDVHLGATTLRRYVDTGSGYNAQPPHLVHFGLGSSIAIDSVVVKWPSGIEQERYNVSTNQVLQLTEANEAFVSISDTVANYSSTVHIPVRIDEDVTGKSIVSAEVLVAYDNSVVTPGSPDKTLIAGTMVASGWSVEENVLPGVGGIDTLTIAMSTAVDTLTGTGDLVLLVFEVANIRQPTSTALELTTVLFNDGSPVATKTNGSITVIGTAATISTSPDSIRPSEFVSITLDDVDLDLDVGVVEQVSVTAFSVTYGDSQYVTLTETGVNTGSFTGSVSTEFSAVAGTPQDGVIGTIAGDSIGVVATDVLTSEGITSPLYVFPVRVYGGTDGVVAVSYVVQALDGRNGVRDTVRVEVTDADLDLDVGLSNQVSATITNAISGETESVTLIETGVNTGVFQIRVPSIAGASGTNNDGVLSLASWDTLNVSYTDSLTAQGGVSPVGDITRVVNLFGDVQPNDQVQAFDAARLLAISVGLISSNTQTTLVGDVDGGGTIAAFDASLVLQYVVRLIDRFPVQTDFTADPKNHPFEKPVLSNIIALGTMVSQDDGTYLVPVQLAEREGVLSGTLTFGMDAGIEVMDVDLTNAYGSFMVAHNTTDEGVKVAFAGSQSELNGSGDVLMLRVRGAEGAPIRLSLDHVSLNGQSLTPSVNIEAMEVVETPITEFVTELHQNLPNPFNPQTTIRYGLADAGQVSVVIYSVTGQRVRTLVSAFQESGAYQVTWDGQDALGHQVSSGVYLMRMQTDGFIQTRKMLLLR